MAHSNHMVTKNYTKTADASKFFFPEMKSEGQNMCVGKFSIFFYDAFIIRAVKG